MPWIGARTRYDNKIVQVKVFGPNKKFSVNDKELADYLRDVTKSAPDSNNLSAYVGEKLSRALRDDDNALWMEVEVHDTEDFSFSGEPYVIQEAVSA